jgi:hypothetical protein
MNTSILDRIDTIKGKSEADGDLNSSNTFQVTYNKNSLFSILIKYTQYFEGAAHPTTYYQFQR